MLVIQTPERTQQVVNTSVQHIVDTVEVEKHKIIDETVQKPTIQEKINQVTKHIKIPQVQFLDKADDMLVDVQRQISVAQTMQRTMEVPPSHVTDKVSDIPVVAPRQILPMALTVQKTSEILQLQFPDQVVDVPLAFVVLVPHVQVMAETVEKLQLLSEVQAPNLRAVKKTVEGPQLQIVEETAKTPETQMTQGTQTSESLGNAPVYQVTQAGHVEEVEIGALLPTKSASSLFVATPVSENPPVWFTDRVVDVPVVAQRHVPTAPRVQEIVEMSVVQFSDGHVDMSGVT